MQKNEWKKERVFFYKDWAFVGERRFFLKYYCDLNSTFINIIKLEVEVEVDKQKTNKERNKQISKSKEMDRSVYTWTLGVAQSSREDRGEATLLKESK